MNLELHHFFILVESDAKVADLLLPLGIKEGTRNKHEGQGTSNRRFHFLNGALEFLYVHDDEEATTGAGKDMRLLPRARDNSASPFGLIFSKKDDLCSQPPFDGWTYQPDYFKPPMAFHIGENSIDLAEPLCIYMPFVKASSSTQDVTQDIFKSINNVRVYIKSEPMSEVLRTVGKADRLSVISAEQHLIEVTFNDEQQGYSKDFRPDIPLIFHW